MGTNLTETDTCNIMVFNMTYWPEDTTKSRFDEHIEFEGFHTTDIYEFGEGNLIYILNEYLRVSPCVTHTNNRLNKWVSLDLFVDQELRDSLADTIHTAFDDLLVSSTFILEKEAD